MIPLSALLADLTDADDPLPATTSVERLWQGAQRAQKRGDAWPRSDPNAIPTAVLPPRAAVLGPLPPSAPINVARWAVATASLPAFESSLSDLNLGHTTTPSTPSSPRRSRAVIVTGPRAAFHAALEDEDEPHLRPLSSSDTRIDVRYCPSPGHARLLLTLLTSSEALPPQGQGQGQGQAQTQVYDVPPPSVLILHDLLALFEENDENAPGARFGSTPASAYLDLIAAARAAATHLNCALLVLEPRAPDALPILPTGATAGGAANVPPAAKERRVPLDDGMRWLLGCVVRVRPKEREKGDNGDEEEGADELSEVTIDDTTTTAATPPAKSFIARRPVSSSEFAPPSEGGHVWVWVEGP